MTPEKLREEDIAIGQRIKNRRTLGHADSKITREIYLHVTEKMREQDAARLDMVSLLEQKAT